MGTLTYTTAGESHGPAMVTVVSGLPAGLRVDVDLINDELARRQGGYGRGGRQRIETDTVEFLSGLRHGCTLGSPVTMVVRNKDSRMDDEQRTPAVHRPRPGHADLAGSIKWLTTDCRSTLERASARETAARVAAGALSRSLLREMGIDVFGFVRSIMGAGTDLVITPEILDKHRTARDASDTYCPDAEATDKQCAIIREAKVNKDTVGGLIEAHAVGCPPGLGSCMHWHEKLDARLAYAVMGIQAMKSVEIGLGKDVASLPGSKVHDHITYDIGKQTTPTLGFDRPTNNAGGTEGGMTNGMPIVVRAAMKPIATLLRGLPSVDLNTKEAQQSQYERSDVCAVSAASVVLENVVAFEVARAAVDKFAGDSLEAFMDSYERYLMFARSLPLGDEGTQLA